MDNGTSIALAERTCNSDVLFAEFRNLKKCHGIGCGWVNFDDLTQWVNETTDYRFCKNSNTSFDIRGQC